MKTPCAICDGGATSSGESIAWSPWPDDEGCTAEISTDRAEWCLTVEPLNSQWHWEVALRGPDVGPYLDSWFVEAEGDADSRPGRGPAGFTPELSRRPRCSECTADCSRPTRRQLPELSVWADPHRSTFLKVGAGPGSARPRKTLFAIVQESPAPELAIHLEAVA
jgi:hypothetical protein